MKRIFYMTCALVLTACGGGGGRSDPPDTPPVAISNTLPVSATASVNALMSYLKTTLQITDDNAAELDITNATLPINEDMDADESI
jgi:hypothetical protein